MSSRRTAPQNPAQLPVSSRRRTPRAWRAARRGARLGRRAGTTPAERQAGALGARPLAAPALFARDTGCVVPAAELRQRLLRSLRPKADGQPLELSKRSPDGFGGSGRRRLRALRNAPGCAGALRGSGLAPGRGLSLAPAWLALSLFETSRQAAAREREARHVLSARSSRDALFTENLLQLPPAPDPHRRTSLHLSAMRQTPRRPAG
jgi:hypothetical protein